MKRPGRLILEKSPVVLREHIAAIVRIADGEKEALGFLPPAAFEDAVDQKRLTAMLIEDKDRQRSVAGYILFGGVYPHARVQQIGVRPEWRRHGIGSALLTSLIADLERLGFLSVKAHVASDLPDAQEFYGRHGFEVVSTKAGGKARNRSIIVRSRDLDTEHLFSSLAASEAELEFAIRLGHEAPLYTFDLNVFFDLVRNRKRYAQACVLFGEALRHRIRLGVAAEFVNELQRTTSGPMGDPVLQMALQLPRLPPPSDRAALDALAAEIHRLVFAGGHAAVHGSPQAVSDARHLAHSALSRVSAFITSDKALLAARDQLRQRFGVDVASLDEMISILPPEIEHSNTTHKTGSGFDCISLTEIEEIEHLENIGIEKNVLATFVDTERGRKSAWRLAIKEEEAIVAIACLATAPSVDRDSSLLVHVEPGHLDRELYVDYLLDAAIRYVCAPVPGAVRLRHLAGQSMVTALAKTRGFMPTETGRDLIKVAIGCPLTDSNWDQARRQIRLKTGILIASSFAELANPSCASTVVDRREKRFAIPRERLEDLFGPTIILWPGREGVVVPIRRAYADELLGTNPQTQMPFVESRDAAFLSRRAYVSTPRARGVMRPGLPILFYESGRQGGRRAIVAVGRIVDSVIVRKDQTPSEVGRRLVVDDLSAFSASDDVLLTTFDNLMTFPSPVSLSHLRRFDALGPTNLRTANLLSHDQVMSIFRMGWSYV